MSVINPFINFIKSCEPNINPQIIFDIGSRDLDQSIEFNFIFPDAKIFAFEPNPAQFRICAEKALNYPNITVTQKAISDVNTVLDFYVTHGNVGASSLLEPIDIPFATSQDYTKIQVETIRLKDWLNENGINNIDIMWMDVQGVELTALKSLEEKIKNVKFLHCEASELPYYKNHVLKNELEKFLKDLNFELVFYNAPGHPYREGDIMAVNKTLF